MHGKDVKLDNVSMQFGDFVAVQPTDLEIKAGEFFSILGPSGCGKTTILRMISGFIEPTTGAVRIGGEGMGGVGPNRRPTALIFQNLALFPLMTVWENVAFGLEVRGVSKSERRKRADELLSLVSLEGQEDKLPTELSGGQRQRVAIARALAVEPAVLLLDEPLSALDLKLRQHMRAELKRIQRTTGVTFVYITHDQGEALTMSDRIAVMKAGVVEQVGTTDEVYDRPTTAFVASFVGETNRIDGRVSKTDGEMAELETAVGPLRGLNRDRLSVGDTATLFVRPEKMRLSTEAKVDCSFKAEFQRRDLEGPFVNLFFNRDGNEYALHQTNAGEAGRSLTGQHEIGFVATDAFILKPGEVSDE